MFRVRFPADQWRSCLNDAELEAHLVLANNSSGELMYQQSKSQLTRHFLQSILEGKGLEATCILEIPSVSWADIKSGVVPSSTAPTFAAASSWPSLQSLSSNNLALFTQTLANSDRLWFHSMDVSTSTSPSSTLDFCPPAGWYPIERHNEKLKEIACEDDVETIYMVPYVHFCSVASSSPNLPSIYLYNSICECEAGCHCETR